MAEDNIVLKQRNSLGFEVSLKLLDGRELVVVTKGKNVKQRYSVDILSLDSLSKKQLYIAWIWLFSSIVFFVCMLVLLKFLPSYLGDNKNLLLGMVLFVGTVGAILCLIQFWKRSLKKQVFFSLNAHTPIIELIQEKPTKEVFSLFVNSLEQCINNIRQHMNLSEDKQLIGEMKMLRRLSDEGIIRKKDYESAKEKLFSGFDSQMINREG